MAEPVDFVVTRPRPKTRWPFPTRWSFPKSFFAEQDKLRVPQVTTLAEHARWQCQSPTSTVCSTPVAHSLGPSPHTRWAHHHPATEPHSFGIKVALQGFTRRSPRVRAHPPFPAALSVEVFDNVIFHWLGDSYYFVIPFGSSLKTLFPLKKWSFPDLHGIRILPTK